MGLFRNKEDDKKKLKSSIKKLMNAYAKEESVDKDKANY